MKKLFLAIILILLFSLGYFVVNKKDSAISVNVVNTLPSKNYIDTSLHFSLDLFNIGLAEQKKVNFTNNSNKNIKLAVIPHHTLPSFLISSLLSNIKSPNIVLLGPDHYLRSKTPFTVSNLGWNTYFGNLDLNTSLINVLQQNLANKISIDNKLVQYEHSIGGVAPYIKYHNPNSSLVGIAVSPKATMQDIDMLINVLSNNLQDCVVIAAIDFSHYLTLESASKKDELTRELILNKDYLKIFNLSNDYMDDPKSLVTVLKLAEKNNLKTNIILNTNSGVLTNKPFAQTTSYFLITFTP